MSTPTFHPCKFEDVRRAADSPLRHQQGFRYYFDGGQGYSTEMGEIPADNLKFLAEAIEQVAGDHKDELLDEIAQQGVYVGDDYLTAAEVAETLKIAPWTEDEEDDAEEEEPVTDATLPE